MEAFDALEMAKLKAWQSELLKEQMQQQIHCPHVFSLFPLFPAPNK